MNLASLARRTLPLIDLTNLDDDCDAAAIDALCADAVTEHGSVAAVCVWPRFVAQAAAALRGSGVLVATVVNFPEGGADVTATVGETTSAIAAGADEIDVVIPFRALVAGDDDAVGAMVGSVKRTTGADHVVKAILETGELPDQRWVMRAAELSIGAGADFVKTSTGKSKVSATPEAAFTMLEAIKRTGRPVGLKAAGGIRTLAQAAVYLDLADDVMGAGWVTPATFRFGASSLLAAVLAAL